MLAFDSEDWHVVNGKTIIALIGKGFISLQVSCSKEVQLLGVSGMKKVLLKIGKEFRLWAKFSQFEKLELVGQGTTDYGYRVSHRHMQDGEILNNENFLVSPMPGNRNMLLQIRDLFQAERDRNCAPIMDPEDFPGSARYVIDDDDFDFEEEILAFQQKFEWKPFIEVDDSDHALPYIAAEPPLKEDNAPPAK